MLEKILRLLFVCNFFPEKHGRTILGFYVECPNPEIGTRHATITGATVGAPAPVGAVVGQTCVPPAVALVGTQAPRTCSSCGSFTEVATRCAGIP